MTTEDMDVDGTTSGGVTTAPPTTTDEVKMMDVLTKLRLMMMKKM
jgi:hypothetical protein